MHCEIGRCIYIKLYICLHSFLLKGINSPQALKKILSLSEEGSLDRHKKQSEDTVSSASSHLSSPPTSPQSSPRKGTRCRTFLILFPEGHRLRKFLKENLYIQNKLLLLFQAHMVSKRAGGGAQVGQLKALLDSSRQGILNWYRMWCIRSLSLQLLLIKVFPSEHLLPVAVHADCCTRF